jgi:lambda repressor-like predicted transcriptional regulator
VREARRKAFADAQAAGLSLREIAQETGLHHSTKRAALTRSRLNKIEGGEYIRLLTS